MGIAEFLGLLIYYPTHQYFYIIFFKKYLLGFGMVRFDSYGKKSYRG